jgi:hypothetical protein
VTFWNRCAALALPLALLAAPSEAALLSITVVEGLFGTDGSTVLSEPLAQESLSGSTLTQLGSPLLFDPDLVGSPTGTLGITVRLANISDLSVAFPDVLPGVSVLTGISGYPGFSARTNVGAGGAANRTGGAGTEGTVSRTASEMVDSLFATGSPVEGSQGGGGGAATGIRDTWLSLTGANGAHLAAYLAGLTLAPGEWVDIPDFATLIAFHRGDDLARLALGFDLPTFSFGGVSVTTGAWTGSFSGPGGPTGGSGGNGGAGGDPVAAPEPGTLGLTVVGLGLVLGGSRRRFGLARERR